MASIGATTDVSCYGYNDGSISVIAAGGTPAYQYSIDGGATWSTSNILTGLNPGLYTIDIKDASNCPDNMSVTITEPTLLVVSIGSTTDVSCFGMSDGEISITTTGGTPSYQYSIDGGTTWSTSNVFSGLTAGLYTRHF